MSIQSILVPIDFSDNSIKAYHVALDIAQKTSAKILLHHTLAPSFTLSDEKEKNNESLLRKKLEDITKKDQQGISQIHFASGDLVNNIEKLVHRNKIDLLVMGTTGASGLSRVLLGSNAEKIVEASLCASLIIPASHIFDGFKRVIFSSDYREIQDDNALDILKDLLVIYSSELKIIHIEKSFDHIDYEEYIEQSREHHLFEGIKHSFRNIKYKDSLHAIKKYIYNHPESNLFALVHRNKGFFRRIFTDNFSENLVMDAPLPILVLPEKIST